MTQNIKTNLQTVNLEAFDRALKAALTKDVCHGVTVDRFGVHIIFADTATPEQITQGLAIAAAHNPETLTPEQQEAETGRTDVADLVGKINTALSDLTAKRSAFNNASTLLNAGPLLLEMSQDMIGILKALRYILKRVN